MCFLIFAPFYYKLTCHLSSSGVDLSSRSTSSNHLDSLSPSTIHLKSHSTKAAVVAELRNPPEAARKQNKRSKVAVKTNSPKLLQKFSPKLLRKSPSVNQHQTRNKKRPAAVTYKWRTITTEGKDNLRQLYAVTEAEAQTDEVVMRSESGYESALAPSPRPPPNRRRGVKLPDWYWTGASGVPDTMPAVFRQGLFLNSAL